MLFLLVPLHNLTDLNRLLSNNIATALYLGKGNYIQSYSLKPLKGCKFSNQI
jgi:hypothetical protein